MELLPTLQTHLGMVLSNGAAQLRPQKYMSIPPNSDWTIARPPVQVSAFEPNDQDNSIVRFLRVHKWGNASSLLVDAYTKRRLPFAVPSGGKTEMTTRMMITNNLIELGVPLKPQAGARIMKSVIANHYRIDLEQAVALVLRFLPMHAPSLIPLIPSMLTRSCMWSTKFNPWAVGADLSNISDTRIDSRRRKHLVEILIRAAKGKSIGLVTGAGWSEVAEVLFRIRRNRPGDLSRGLNLPKRICDYYPEGVMGEPAPRIDNAIVVSKKNFLVIQRYLWRIVPYKPEKVLRRDILELERRVVYGDDKLPHIEQTTDWCSLAYTFIAAQRRLQLKVVSDLRGRFLMKGESDRMQQNTPFIQTSFEVRLGELAMASENVDWDVLGAIQNPRGVDSAAEDKEKALKDVDSVCMCLERYVWIYGRGHTETLRPMPGRRGGFRGPVDDWNKAVDVLGTLRRQSRIETIPKADKFLALDIMSYNNSWRDDVFAEAKMPPEWYTWLEKRRAENKCLVGDLIITID